MNAITKTSYGVAGIVLSSIANLSALASDPTWTFWVNKASTTSQNLENRPLSEAVQYYVNFLMTFLYLVAVLYALWGGFLILTAGGEDEKVKKGKTILIQWGLWLLVIWLAGTIVKWILSVLVS